MKNSQEVLELQEFLTAQGNYSGPITGNFYSLTLAGVKAFQTASEISPVSGYFGPLSRAKANSILSEITDEAGEIFETPTTTDSVTNDDVVASIQEMIASLLSQIALLQSQLTATQNLENQIAQQTQVIQEQNQAIQEQNDTLSQIASATQEIADNTTTTEPEAIVPEAEPEPDLPTGTISYNGTTTVNEVEYYKFDTAIEPFQFYDMVVANLDGLTSIAYPNMLTFNGNDNPTNWTNGKLCELTNYWNGGVIKDSLDQACSQNKYFWFFTSYESPKTDRTIPAGTSHYIGNSDQYDISMIRFKGANSGNIIQIEP